MKSPYSGAVLKTPLDANHVSIDTAGAADDTIA